MVVVMGSDDGSDDGGDCSGDGGGWYDMLMQWLQTWLVKCIREVRDSTCGREKVLES